VAIIDTVLLLVGLTFPWAAEIVSSPSLDAMGLFGDAWTLLCGAAVMCSAIWTLRLRSARKWRKNLVRAIGVMAAIILTIRCAPLLIQPWLWDFDVGSDYFWLHAQLNKEPILATITGVWFLVAAQWSRQPTIAIFSDGVIWTSEDKSRKLTKRICASLAAALASSNLIVLWYRISSTNTNWFHTSATLVRNVGADMAPWIYFSLSIAAIALSLELAFSAEAPVYQRWLNPIRALVLLSYASTLGVGSGYLFWFTTPSYDLGPWAAVSPAIFAIMASTVQPRGGTQYR
jgi:hypothetical protein